MFVFNQPLIYVAMRSRGALARNVTTLNEKWNPRGVSVVWLTDEKGYCLKIRYPRLRDVPVQIPLPGHSDSTTQLLPPLPYQPQLVVQEAVPPQYVPAGDEEAPPVEEEKKEKT